MYYYTANSVLNFCKHLPSKTWCEMQKASSSILEQWTIPEEKWTCVMKYWCINFLIYCMTRSFLWVSSNLNDSITPNIRSQSNEGSKGPTAKNAKRSYHTIINKKIFSSIPHDESLLFFQTVPRIGSDVEVVWDKSFPSRKWGLEAIFFQKQRTENGGGVERRKRRPSSQPQLLVAAV